MISLTLPEAAQRLQQAHTLLLLTHRRPDGDTVGSAAALCRGLRSLGKEAAVLENPQLTDKYRPYLQGLTCPSPLPGAMTVSVDVAGREMLCKGAGDLPVDFILDHHGTNPGFAPEGLIDPSAAACGEIVYSILRALGVCLDRAMAEALYVGSPPTRAASATPTPPPAPFGSRPPAWRQGRRPIPSTGSFLKPPACPACGSTPIWLSIWSCCRPGRSPFAPFPGRSSGKPPSRRMTWRTSPISLGMWRA